MAQLEVDALVSAVSELTEIRELLWRASGYGRMRGYADSSDVTAGALRGAAETAQAEIDAKLLFFELEWVALDDERAEALSPARVINSTSPPITSGTCAPAGLTCSVTSRNASWLRRACSGCRPGSGSIPRTPLASRPRSTATSVPMAQAMSLLGSAVREQRLQAMAAIAVGAVAGLPARVAAYNQVLGEKAVERSPARISDLAVLAQPGKRDH